MKNFMQYLFRGPSAATSITHVRSRYYEIDKTMTIIFEDGSTVVLENALFFHYPEPNVLPWFNLVFKRPQERTLMEKFDKPFTVCTGGKEFRTCTYLTKEFNFGLNFFMIKGTYV